MITSEFEYYLIAELITMPDRELAHKIELHIWYRCSVPQPRILAAYLAALKESCNSEEFCVNATEIINQSGLEFFTDDAGWQVRTPNTNPPGYIEIPPEELFKAELQEPKEE